jgi:hypothetical protein
VKLIVEVCPRRKSRLAERLQNRLAARQQVQEGPPPPQFRNLHRLPVTPELGQSLDGGGEQPLVLIGEASLHFIRGNRA